MFSLRNTLFYYDTITFAPLSVFSTPHLQTGDLITQIEKVTDDWCEGSHNGRKGRFPAAFVDITS